MNAKEVIYPDNLIRGICFIYNTLIIAIIDTSATHYFIFLGCDKHLNHVMSHMMRGMVIDTPTNGLMTISLVWLNCPVNFGDVDFKLDLVFFAFRGYGCYLWNELVVVFWC